MRVVRNVLLLFPCASYDTLEVTFKVVNDIQVVDYNSIQKKKNLSIIIRKLMAFKVVSDDVQFVE